MSAEDITRIIEKEINNNWLLTNLHNVDLRTSLVTPPVKKLFEDSFSQAEPIELWLVLEEKPNSNSGYAIVFDEKTKKFGLASPGFNGLYCFIGFHGSFIDTFKSM